MYNFDHFNWVSILRMKFHFIVVYIFVHHNKSLLIHLRNFLYLLMPDNSLMGDGTYFLQEYMIPRDSNSICLYDTRSLSDNSDKDENIRMLKGWMTKGVHHGELVVRFEYLICLISKFTYMLIFASNSMNHPSGIQIIRDWGKVWRLKLSIKVTFPVRPEKLIL